MQRSDVKGDSHSIATPASSIASTTASSIPDSTILVDPPSYTESNQENQDAGSAAAEVVPWDGDTVLILHRGTGHAIAVNDDGQVRLTDINNVGLSEGCRWKCVDKSGWFGFKHAGRYLGHDNKNFRADAKNQKYRENFVVKKHPSGGYQLMNMHRWSLRSMGVAEDGKKLVVSNEAALWDFVKL